MSRKYKIRDQTYPHFVSFAVINWIDLFVRPAYREILLESISYCQKEKGLILHAWCIMPSHVHLIMSTEKDPMQNILRDLKSFTSRQLKEEIQKNPQESRKEWLIWMMKRAGIKNNNNNEWQLWQQHNQPIELSSNSKLDQRLLYLHNNPVKAGFVDRPEYWKYCSAGDYAGHKGLLEVDLIV
ncbi:MAG: transposase [Balneolaceae bacterium]|nr:transposase [Balneolaceae bacterium]MDR9408173.1 transposase [Balneolaceae bacterium]